nr:sex-lethal homolog [Nicotiana tomentosiformis]
MVGLTTASERNISFQNNVDIVLKEHLLSEVLQNIHCLKISRKKDPVNSLDDKSESRLYVGNLDLRISEAALIKMFSPYGKIIAEDFLWHTRGPKCGEPRGYAFVQFSTKEEAVLAKENIHEFGLGHISG